MKALGPFHPQPLEPFPAFPNQLIRGSPRAGSDTSGLRPLAVSASLTEARDYGGGRQLRAEKGGIQS